MILFLIIEDDQKTKRPRELAKKAKTMSLQGEIVTDVLRKS